MPTFAGALNCIDGRVQLPLTAWLRHTQSVDFVDLITEPGMDRLLADEPERARQLLLPKLRISVVGHGSTVLAIAAHHDCLGNPVDEATHREMLQRAVRVVLGWELGVKVIGVWLGPTWDVDVVLTRAPGAHPELSRQ
jgi:hypothetical protein